jgi:hypothetical protein
MTEQPEVSRGMSRQQFLGVLAAGAATTALGRGAAGSTASAAQLSSGVQAGAYYFPQWHVDPLNEYWFGRGWSEWELLKHARPRYPGHYQPKEPAWGMEDEASPAVMERKIDAAADHGLGAFIFDWYWYTTGPGRYEPFLHRCLEDGFLEADNVKRLGFGLMWANHNWDNLFPVHRASQGGRLRVQGTPLDGPQSAASFDALTDYVVERYMTHPSYWRVDGGAYFSIYEIGTFVAGFGGDVGAARGALDRFREKARAAGVGDLHLNYVVRGAAGVSNDNRNLGRLGMDSATSYVWYHHSPLDRFPETPYPEVREHATGVWRKFSEGLDKPYFPNVTMGWDSTPRCTQSDMWERLGYPWTPNMTHNPPREFATSLELARDFAAGQGISTITINAWNEWTEGSYLEPDKVHGNGYLNAVKRVLGARKEA